MQDVILELHQAYKNVLERLLDPGDPAGKVVLADLKARCFVDRSSFNRSSAEQTAFNEGRRSILLHMLHMADPENFKPKPSPKKDEAEEDF